MRKAIYLRKLMKQANKIFIYACKKTDSTIHDGEWVNIEKSGIDIFDKENLERMNTIIEKRKFSTDWQDDLYIGSIFNPFILR
jgi:hypothetical protein